VAATGDDSMAYRLGWSAVAREAVGNWAFAPIIDIDFFQTHHNVRTWLGLTACAAWG
jgi:hypothetical protein